MATSKKANPATGRNLSLKEARKIVVGPVKDFAIWLSVEIGKVEHQMAEMMTNRMAAGIKIYTDPEAVRLALGNIRHHLLAMEMRLHQKNTLRKVAEQFSQLHNLHPWQLQEMVAVEAAVFLDAWKYEESQRAVKDAEELRDFTAGG